MPDNLNLTKINRNESSARHYKLITVHLVALINMADTLPAIIVVIVAPLIDTLGFCWHYDYTTIE